MLPSFSAGELLLCASLRLSRGSVVVFRDPSGPILAHRLVRKTPNGAVLTRGDAHLRNDRRPVRPEDVLGVVTAVMRDGKVIPLKPANPELIRLRLLARMAWRKLTSSLGLRRTRGTSAGPLARAAQSRQKTG